MLASRESATSTGKGHGRIERRTLTATPILNDPLRRQGWPDVGQVFRIVRERTIRGHWAIENSLHHVRDVTLGEDAYRVRPGSAPQLLAALRNLVLGTIGPIKHRSKAATLRRFAAKPREAIPRLFGTRFARPG